jgi:hypothetical protein
MPKLCSDLSVKAKFHCRKSIVLVRHIQQTVLLGLSHPSRHLKALVTLHTLEQSHQDANRNPKVTATNSVRRSKSGKNGVRNS